MYTAGMPGIAASHHGSHPAALPSALPFMVHEVPAARSRSGRSIPIPLQGNTSMVPEETEAPPRCWGGGAGSPQRQQAAPSDLPAVPRVKASHWHPRGWKILPGPLVQSPQGPRHSVVSVGDEEATTSSPGPRASSGRSEG